MDILQRIAYWAKATPDHPAYMHRGMRLTYRQLEERSNAVAAWLVERFGHSKRPILIYGHMQPELPVAFLACAKVGRAYIPVDDSVPEGRLCSILKNAEAEAILAISRLPTEAAPAALVIDDLSRLLRDYEGKRPDPEAQVQPDDNLYLIYTSGSTGNPKGVQITNDNLRSFVEWIVPVFAGGSASVSLNQAPYSFDLSIMDLYPTLVHGGTVWALDRSYMRRPAELFAGLKESGISVWTSTPSFAEYCLRNPEFGQAMLPQLRTFLFCGEVLSPGCAGQLLDRFPQAEIYNTYGPTEATVAVTSVLVNRALLANHTVLPVGRVKPDCRIRIVSESGHPLPEGSRGEIVIAGPSVGEGYYRNPVLTERVFSLIDDPELGKVRTYRTGDSGYMREGLLFYGGRLDFQVKLHGYRIEPEEIEHYLRGLKGVRASVVLPRIVNGVCQYLTAFLVTDTPPADVLGWSIAVKKELSANLPDYMVPRRVIWKPALPVTINGKVDRNRLAEEV